LFCDEIEQHLTAKVVEGSMPEFVPYARHVPQVCSVVLVLANALSVRNVMLVNGGLDVQILTQASAQHVLNVHRANLDQIVLVLRVGNAAHASLVLLDLSELVVAKLMKAAVCRAAKEVTPARWTLLVTNVTLDWLLPMLG
jgi:hypothetical protein